MDEALDKLLLWIEKLDVKICGIEHASGSACTQCRQTVTWDSGRRVATLEPLPDVPGEPGVVILKIEGSFISSQWYIELPAAFRAVGIERIELKSWGWWISDKPGPDAVWVVDHVTCYTPGPLTGSEAARRGEAFIGMRDAYDTGRTMASGFLEGTENLKDAVLWHTIQSDELTDEEIKTARSAGCTVAGPNVAPWAIGARAAGCEFAATVTDLLPAKSASTRRG